MTPMFSLKSVPQQCGCPVLPDACGLEQRAKCGTHSEQASFPAVASSKSATECQSERSSSSAAKLRTLPAAGVPASFSTEAKA